MGGDISWQSQHFGKKMCIRDSHINNGVDLEEFEYNKRNNHVCDEDLESNDKKIVYVGSIRLANNLGQLIKAAKVLKEKDVYKRQI